MFLVSLSWIRRYIVENAIKIMIVENVPMIDFETQLKSDDTHLSINKSPLSIQILLYNLNAKRGY